MQQSATNQTGVQQTTNEQVEERGMELSSSCGQNTSSSTDHPNKSDKTRLVGSSNHHNQRSLAGRRSKAVNESSEGELSRSVSESESEDEDRDDEDEDDEIGEDEIEEDDDELDEEDGDDDEDDNDEEGEGEADEDEEGVENDDDELLGGAEDRINNDRMETEDEFRGRGSEDGNSASSLLSRQVENIVQQQQREQEVFVATSCDD